MTTQAEVFEAYVQAVQAFNEFFDDGFCRGPPAHIARVLGAWPGKVRGVWIEWNFPDLSTAWIAPDGNVKLQMP